MVKNRTQKLPYTIFVIEKSKRDMALLRNVLQMRGFKVREFKRAELALRAALRSVPSMFIIETDLPEEGLAVCRRIRETAALSLLPVIFVSDRSQEADRVAGLEAGADDYITKPFGSRELVARVRAHLRRSYELTRAGGMRFGHLEIDPEAVTLKVNGVRVDMAISEFRLLEYFARNPGRTFSRLHLLKMIRWGSRVVKPRVVDVYVNRIRERIELDKRRPTYLRTVRRLGYCFQPPTSLVPSRKAKKMRSQRI
jgi:DNA-binding response OmpR family regulator